MKIPVLTQEHKSVRIIFIILKPSLLENYLNYVNILEDATLVIKKEKAEESKRSEQSGQLYNTLISYVQKLKQ